MRNSNTAKLLFSLILHIAIVPSFVGLQLSADSISASALASKPLAATPKKLSCQPALNYKYCVKVAVLINSPLPKVYAISTNIKEMNRIFPGYEFKYNASKKINYYYSRKTGDQDWTLYEVLVLKSGKQFSGQTLGKNRVDIRFDHFFEKKGDKTLSTERISYNINTGVLSSLLNYFVASKEIREMLFQAQGNIKKISEQSEPK